MNINLWNLVNDEHDMPKLNVINNIDYHPFGDEILRPYDTIPILCRLSDMHKAHAENIYMATYDHFGDLIGFFHVATGHMDKVAGSDRIKATCLLLSGGYSFEVFHNHPIDDLTPSEADKSVCCMEKILANYLEAIYDGAYIVTRGGWCSVITEEMHRFDENELKFIAGDP